MRFSFTSIVLALILITKVSYSQSEGNQDLLNDPLGKPNIWESLTQSPLDSVLWTMYLGKPWVSMTYTEKEQIGKWKLNLKQTITETEVFVTVDNAELWESVPSISVNESKRQGEEKIQQSQYLTQLETMMLEEPDVLSMLKSNIKANFVVIEATYEEEFGDLGVQYTYYHNKYPNGDYNQDTWVREKSLELKELKRKEFQKLKNQLMSADK